MNDIRNRIKSGEISKTVNAEKQNRHIRDTAEYIEGRSYLLPGVNAQTLVDKYHGTGEMKFTESGRWKNKEAVDADIDIGVKINPATGEKTTTNRFTIHYSKTGTHIVPAAKELII